MSSVAGANSMFLALFGPLQIQFDESEGQSMFLISTSTADDGMLSNFSRTQTPSPGTIVSSINLY